MFGFEKSDHVEAPFLFDLEKNLQDPKNKAEMLKKIEEKVLQLKGSLRTGSSQEIFEKEGSLLEGYVALKKVISRMQPVSANQEHKNR